MEKWSGPGLEIDTDDWSVRVAFRPTQRLGSLFGRLEAFSEEMQKMYGEKDWKLNTAMKCRTDFLQGVNEQVRVYTNPIKANRRPVAWLLPDNTYHYEIAWSRLRPRLKFKIKPLTPMNAKFDSMEELFDRATNSDVMPDSTKPQQQLSHQQQRSQENRLNKAARKGTSARPYPSKQNHCSPTSQTRTRMIIALPFLGCPLSSMKLAISTEYGYAMGHPNIKHPAAQNEHSPTSPTTLLLQPMENKSNASTPSTVSNKETSLPLLVPSWEGEDGWIGAWIAGIGYKGVDGNIRWHSTALDFINAKGCTRELESPHVKWLFVWNSGSRFITNRPPRPDMRSRQRIANNRSIYWLRRYKHSHGSTTSQ